MRRCPRGTWSGDLQRRTPCASGRYLATTNVTESPTSGVPLRTRRVTHWQHGQTVLRGAAAAHLETDKHFRRIMGYRDLWMLEALPDEGEAQRQEQVA